MSPENHTATGWYVVASKPRKERFAEINLRQQGFETFWPNIRSVVRRRGQPAQALEPLFPGYLFVRFNSERDRWQSINGTIGVQRLICAKGGLPTPIPVGAMREIFDRCPQGTWEVGAPELQPGQQVDLIRGPFIGLCGRFEKMVSRDRVRVLMSLLDSDVSVVMPAAYLARAA